uniref:SHSP domain-containing protein n=1 Tax=Cannabis sativa TaxID=3483 RepID=A0A803PUL3_CANSA
MSSVPSPFRGRIGDPLDTYAIDVWDPLKDFSFFFPDYTSPTSAGEESSIPVPSQVKKEETKGRGMFLRWLRLPENAKLDQVKAGMECGLLTMVVPKAEVKKLDVSKAIQISGS